MPIPPRISLIGAKKFRGATTESEIKLDPSKPFVLIFGENGSGKSTIVDAIDIVANRNASLTDISGATLKANLAALGCESQELSASLCVDNKTWVATLGGARIAVSPADGLPKVQVLRRSKILSLIVAVPSDRFQQLKHFIDVDNVQKSEDKLNKARLEYERTVEENSRELAGCERSLEKDFENNRTDDELELTWKEWAKKRSSVEAESAKKCLGEIIEALRADTICRELLSKKNDRQIELNEALIVREKALATLKENAVSSVANPSKLVTLLENAKGYLSEIDSLENCPVCKKPNDLDTISAEVAKSLNEFSKLVELTNAVNGAQSKVEGLERSIADLYEDLVKKCKTLLDIIQALSGMIRFNTAVTAAEYPALAEVDKDRKVELTPALVDDVQRFLVEAIGAVDTLVKERSKLEQFSLIKEAYERLIELRMEAERNRAVHRLLQETLEAVRAQRKAFIQKTLDAVADECDRLYGEIHPGEAIGQVRFALKEEGQGSMNLEGSLGVHKSIPPQAYFSESHLDTLGFCFFLALAKHSTNGEAIVVLDDVFTTVDLNHMERILNLLIKESESFHQLIMTSHQRRWLTFFTTQRAPSKGVHMLTLRDWSMDLGICADDEITVLSSLKQLLTNNKFERTRVGNTAGRLVEIILEEMTKLLEISVQRNRADRYTPKALLQATKRKANGIRVEREALTSNGQPNFVEQKSPELRIIIETLEKRLTDARNIVSDHFNWDDADVTNDDIREFAENAVKLAERFLCPECGCMATKEKNGYLSCPGECGKLRIAKLN